MIEDQENNWSMKKATELVLDQNNAIWSGNTGFSAVKTVYSGKLTDIFTTDQQQIAIITGFATDKKVLKRFMVDLAHPVALVTAVHATQTNNNVLFNAVNYSHSDLMALRDNQIAQICQNIHDNANANIAAITILGVNAAMLTALQNAINAYQAKASTPAAAKAAKKANASDLRDLFKETDSLLKLQLDKLMAPYKATHYTFWKAYKAARIIHDLGATHTRMRVLVKDANDQPLAGASVALLQNNLVIYHAFSGVDGKVNFPKVKPGTFDLKVEKANFTTKTLIGIVFKAGKEVTRTVTLVPGAATGLITVTREGDVAPNSVVNISLNGINTTGLTLVSVEVTLGPLDFYAAPNGSDLPGSTKLSRPVSTQAYAIADFTNAVGFSSENGMLNVHNAGASTAHYKLTFNNLEP